MEKKGVATRLILADNSAVAELLQYLLEQFDYIVTTNSKEKADYIILPSSALAEYANETQTVIWIYQDGNNLKKYHTIISTCIINFDEIIPEYLSKTTTITYSMDHDSADFTARNIRETKGNITFEIVGVGVIGRVKITNGTPECILPVLTVVSAALACGLPFAGALDALNRWERK